MQLLTKTKLGDIQQISPPLELNDSWQEISALTNAIFCSINMDKWLQAHENIILREKKVRLHFTLYPVNQSTAYFYQSKLAEFFNLEDSIERLKKPIKRKFIHLV